MEKGKCLKMEMENKGIDNLTMEDLQEAYYFSKIIKNLMCVEKDGKIVEAMEKAENDDNMDMIEMYEDYPEKKYYRGQPRNSKGQYMSRNGRMGRGYYTEPDYMMDMDKYNMNPMDLRRMDRMTGVHYYTEDGTDRMNSSNTKTTNDNMRMGYDNGWNDGYSEGMKKGGTSNSRMERARRNYEEKHDIASLEELMNAIKEEIDKQKQHMDVSQKNMTKSKLTNIVNAI